MLFTLNYRHSYRRNENLFFFLLFSYFDSRLTRIELIKNKLTHISTISRAFGELSDLNKQ